MTTTEQEATTDWSARLRGAGMRVTQPRLAVLDELAAEPHLAADQVVARVRTRLGPVSVQAVYDSLNSLTAAAILRRFEPAGSAMRYEIAREDNHHHLVCRTCGRVEDVPCAIGTMPCSVPPDTRGFAVDEAEVTYWGQCATCRQDALADDPFAPAAVRHNAPSPNPERNA